MQSRLFVLLALAGMSGASFAAKKQASPPPTPAELSATHGYVRASIPQWEFSTDFRLVNLDRSRKPGRAKLAARQGTRSWEGWVPAGEYVLAGDLNAYDNPKRAALDAADKPYAPVTVRAGEMTAPARAGPAGARSAGSPARSSSSNSMRRAGAGSRCVNRRGNAFACCATRTTSRTTAPRGTAPS
jgi:hypothetical protein